jgi:cytochrome c oxidase subunit 2
MSARLPHDASLHGHLVDGLFNYIAIGTSIAFVIMVVVLLVATLFHRAGRAQARYTHGQSRASHLLTLGVGAAIFFGIDMVALSRSFRDLRGVFWRFPENDPWTQRVEVTAQQWAWTFRYPGADDRFGTPDDIVTLNDLRVMVGVPVYLQLRSKDVIHSFYLPNFRTKIDVVPGNTTRLWFQAVEPGQFEIGCAQHCGVNHYKMRGELTALPADDFRHWAARAAADTMARAGSGPEVTPAGAPADSWTWEGR